MTGDPSYFINHIQLRVHIENRVQHKSLRLPKIAKLKLIFFLLKHNYGNALLKK